MLEDFRNRLSEMSHDSHVTPVMSHDSRDPDLADVGNRGLALEDTKVLRRGGRGGIVGESPLHTCPVWDVRGPPHGCHVDDRVTHSGRTVEIL